MLCVSENGKNRKKKEGSCSLKELQLLDTSLINVYHNNREVGTKLEGSLCSPKSDNARGVTGIIRIRASALGV